MDLTAIIPSPFEIANANKPPIIIPSFLAYQKTVRVIVAPTAKPRKIVAVFIIGPGAASDNCCVVVPISLIT